MKALSAIQEQVRIYASDSTFVLTNNSNAKTRGLDLATKIYRKLANLLSLPEFTRIDTSISVTANTESYNFPSSPKFLNVLELELQNEFGEYEMVPEVKTLLDWGHFSKKNGVFPSVYKLQSVGNQYTIYFAPNPKINSNVRITGVVEPEAFTSGDSETLFYSAILDDALEYLIAAEIVFTDGDDQGAVTLVKKASSLLAKYAGREIRPEEIDPRAKEAA